MNGTPDKVQIFKPFEEAIDLTKQILFRPFDLKKWFVIGFAAWLAHLGTGNYNFNIRGQDWKDVPYVQSLHDTIAQIPHWVLFSAIAGLILLVLAITIVFAWLRARGSFMFIDCIVRNRAAIAEPWREFRREGNSYFLLGLVVGICITFILALTALPFALPLLQNRSFSGSTLYWFCTIAFWAVVLVVLLLGWAIISHFMVVVMYRRRCLAREAFGVALSLIASYPGEITLYCLFWIVVSIGAAIVSCVVVLATCCIAILPYIGTVILLPVFVCLRAFGLRFIRQFGPDYDVWAGISPAPPAEMAVPPPLPPV